MKFHYYPETDSLYIDISEKTSVDSHEIVPGVVLDLDDTGALVGIDLDRTRQKGIAAGMLLVACVVAALSIARLSSRKAQATSEPSPNLKSPNLKSCYDQKTTL